MLRDEKDFLGVGNGKCRHENYLSGETIPGNEIDCSVERNVPMAQDIIQFFYVPRVEKFSENIQIYHFPDL